MSNSEIGRKEATAFLRELVFAYASRGYDELVRLARDEPHSTDTVEVNGRVLRSGIDILGVVGYLRKRVGIEIGIWDDCAQDQCRADGAYVEVYRTGHVRIWW